MTATYVESVDIKDSDVTGYFMPCPLCGNNEGPGVSLSDGCVQATCNCGITVELKNVYICESNQHRLSRLQAKWNRIAINCAAVR